MCNIIYERYFLAKVYFNKFNDAYESDIKININELNQMINSIGFHNMTAINDTVTLHIYSPPF